MSDISKINLPSGDSYDIKDAAARQTASNAIPSSQKGVANGVAELDANGIVPTSQLPAFVDEVIEASTTDDFPVVGSTGKIYVATSTNLTYRWAGSAYVEISPSIALGETSSTAYRGDRGAEAYAHAVTNKGNQYSSGFYKITTNSEGHVTGATPVEKSDITALGIVQTPFIVSIPTSQWSGSAGDYYISVNASNVTANSILVPNYDSDSAGFLNGPVWCVPSAGSFTIHTSALPSDTVTIMVQFPGTMGEAQYQVLADVYSTSQAVAKADIIDALSSTATNKPLSAAMGKELNGKIIAYKDGDVIYSDRVIFGYCANSTIARFYHGTQKSMPSNATLTIAGSISSLRIADGSLVTVPSEATLNVTRSNHYLYYIDIKGLSNLPSNAACYAILSNGNITVSIS